MLLSVIGMFGSISEAILPTSRIPPASDRKDMEYPTGYTILTVPWDGIGMGWGGNTVPT